MTDYFSGIRISRDTPPDGKNRRRYPGNRQGKAILCPARDEVVRFVKSHIKREGAPPTIEQLRAHMGWKRPQSARDVIHKVAGEIGRDVARVMLPESKRYAME